MKKTIYLLILIFLFGNIPLAFSLEEPIQLIIPKEVIFIDDYEFINLYDSKTNNFIIGIEVNNRAAKLNLVEEKETQINIFLTNETLEKIVYSPVPFDTAFKEYKEDKVRIEFGSFSKKIKFKIFLVGLTITNLL